MSNNKNKKELPITIDLVGYCGNNCSKCEIFQATYFKDAKLKKKLAEEAEFYSGLKIKPEDIFCLGCRNSNSHHREHLGINCEILKCASEKKPLTCAHCSYYPCSKVQKHFAKFSSKPTRSIMKNEKKLLKLHANADNLEKWLKKEKKY